MVSFAANFWRFFFAWIVRSKPTLADPDKTRALMAETYLRPTAFHPPKSMGAGISVERIDMNEWPLYRVYSSSSGPSEKTQRPAMLYIHGGSFFKEILAPHWKFIAQVVKDTGLDVTVPIYPLLPRPASTAAQLAQGLMNICDRSEQPIVCIAGDSAGGMLALATSQQLQQEHPDLAKRLRCIVLISPCLDISLSHPDLQDRERDDPWLSPKGMIPLTSHLAGELPLTDPRNSPLFGDIESLPPVIMACGTYDMICADARRLSAKYQGKGTDVGVPGSFKNDKLTYIEEPKLIHVYALMPCSEGKKTRREMMKFIKQHTK